MVDPKPSYKEKNGTTRVGDSLRWLVDKGSVVAPELLQLAGSFTGIKGLGDLVNQINDSPDLSEMDKKMLNSQAELDKEDMINVSNRWKYDMESDSFLSKNIRPICLGFLTLAMALFIVLDSSNLNFKVDPVWVDLLKTLLVTVYLAYFGSRGVEKFRKITKNHNK
jgi:hypothetical protein